MYFEKFSLALLARMGEKLNRGEITTGEIRHLRESILEYQMYLVTKRETLTVESASCTTSHDNCYDS